MATLNPPLKFRSSASYGESMQFQRGLEKIPVKKIQRKLTVSFKHIFLFFFIVMAIFYGLMKFTIFLITWDELEVRRTQVSSEHDFVTRDLESLFETSKLGNLLVLDIARLQDQIERHRWVKEARLRKIFPSTLKVEIKERIPWGILRAGGSLLLIDRDGVTLEHLTAREEADLPLLIDSADFRTAYKEKLAMAWECQGSLVPEDQALVDTIDLSQSDSVSLVLKGQLTRLILGTDRYSEKLKFYLSSKDRLEGEYGLLEYVDLRFTDRIYFKTSPVLQTAVSTPITEEVD